MALDFIYNIINIMKLSPAKGSIWAGALRYVLTVLVAALVTAIVTLALGVVYGIKLAQAPLRPYDVKYQGAHKYSTLYITYLSFAAVAVHRQYKQAVSESERLNSEVHELEAAKAS
ncbi:hypothetical protein G7Y79_00069g096490 [Physcia stellaris]|nr:hypothetical protein G7Y79_00069g096490 [Physcia stellaris]